MASVTNIQSLPVLHLRAGVGAGEDLAFCLAFWMSDGTTPLPLYGIAFTGALIGDDPVDAFTTDLHVGGLSGNLLALVVPAAEKALWADGVYELTILATDGTYAKDLLSESSVTVGGAMPVQVETIPPVDVVTAVPPQLFSLSFLGLPPPVRIGSSQTLASPGFYLVTAPNLVLTLPDPVTSVGQIVIKDLTGSPNATLLGTVDDDPTGSHLRGAYETITLTEDVVGETWIAEFQGGGLAIATERLVIATLNTLPPLSRAPSGGLTELVVNGSTFVSTGLSPPFSVLGRQITWLSTVFDIYPGSTVVAVYNY